ncbi:MAG TPA: hypothetical protein VIE91_00340 [Methylophilaceae bacterium]|jgi:mxaA protein
MKTRFNPADVIASLLMLAGLMLTGIALAEDEGLFPNIKDGIVDMHIVDPDHTVGYTVGDIIERNITLDVKMPYKLVETSLPIIGFERRYKNQLVGIDLTNITHKREEHRDSSTYTLHLEYQVFTNNLVAKHGATPPEYLKLVDANGKIFQFRIPTFDFVISPISVFGAVKIENDMSPFRGPLLLNPEPEKERVKILLALLAISLLGLLYILGVRAWLPMMGGPFARAYRDLKKLPNTDDGLKRAVARVHESLNKTAGNSVFSDTMDIFLVKKPGFKPVTADLERFFKLSQHVFFESSAIVQATDSLAWLKHFCRRCRDCERGLRPEKIIPEKQV